MTYQVEHIEESLRCIFVKHLQLSHSFQGVAAIDQSRAEEKSPRNRWNLPIELPSECANDYSLQREFILVVMLIIIFDDFRSIILLFLQWDCFVP